MGGNLFKTNRRVSSKEHEVISKSVISLLTTLGLNVYPIPFIKEKNDHGDVDLIVESTSTNLEVVKNFLKSCVLDDKNTLITDYCLCGENISFSFMCVQIDLIFIPKRFVNYAINYFSYNDLGNLLGRIAKPLGFKHGHQGLRYKLIYNTTSINEYVLSNDFYSILNILELSVQTYKNGFDTYKDMFDFVISSPYFDKSLFLFENLNNRNRVRDKKRKTYNMFLDYIKDIDKEVKPLNELPFNFVCRYFPSLYNQVSTDLKNHLEHIKTRTEIVKYLRENYNLDGKNLGDIIVQLKTVGLFKTPLNKECIDNVVKEYRDVQ